MVLLMVYTRCLYLIRSKENYFRFKLHVVLHAVFAVYHTCIRQFAHHFFLYIYDP